MSAPANHVTPKQVLLVDNDPDVLESVGYNLEMAGYRVFPAESEQQAGRLLEQEIIHLAIVDVRLRDDEQTSDLTGFNLAKDLPGYIPCIIFTAYEDKESVRRTFQEAHAKQSIDKRLKDAPDRLVREVERLFAQEVLVNFALQIDGEPALETIARQIETPDAPGLPAPSAGDVRQVLQALFYDARRLHISPLLSPEAAPTLSQSGSVLLRAQPAFEDGPGAPVVVKFSSSAEIDCEQTNYARIARHLGGQRRAHLGRSAFSRQIGGLVYSLLGAGSWEKIRLFAEVYRDLDKDRMSGLLERFFCETFGDLYASARWARLNLTQQYTAALRLTPEKLLAAVERFHPGAGTTPELRFPGLQGVLENPIPWAMPGGKFRDFIVDSRACLCHGDLHGQNLLVDAEGHFWLIDFARAAESHALRDFAELETDLKFNLLPISDLRPLLRFERALLSPNRFGERLPEIEWGDERLAYTFEIVLVLRDLAGRLLDLDDNLCEYFQALFLHTLNVLRLRAFSPEKKEHALLAAALLRRRLERWPDWEAGPAGD